MISGWEGTYFDLRATGSGRHPRSATEIFLSDEVAAALRGLRLLDPECERLVHRARATEAGTVLAADDEELDELLGFAGAKGEPRARPSPPAAPRPRLRGAQRRPSGDGLVTAKLAMNRSDGGALDQLRADTDSGGDGAVQSAV